MVRRRLLAIARRLAKAYGDPPEPRHLPPLDELILTVLSQHTSDTNRDRAYADLRRRFPRWDDVAAAPLPAIARAIRRGCLGPTKAVRIRAMLRAVRDEGVALDERAFTKSPDAELWEKLVALPGVGPKTAACVLLFSLDRPYFPVDTHVHRVARRLGLVPPRADAVAPPAAFQASEPPRSTPHLARSRGGYHRLLHVPQLRDHQLEQSRPDHERDPGRGAELWPELLPVRSERPVRLQHRQRHGRRSGRRDHRVPLLDRDPRHRQGSRPLPRLRRPAADHPPGRDGLGRARCAPALHGHHGQEGQARGARERTHRRPVAGRPADDARLRLARDARHL